MGKPPNLALVGQRVVFREVMSGDVLHGAILSQWWIGTEALALVKFDDTADAVQMRMSQLEWEWRYNLEGQMAEANPLFGTF